MEWFAEQSAVSCIRARARRSCGLSVAAIWNHVGKSVLWPLCFYFKQLFSALVLFLFFCFPPPTFFHCLIAECEGCPGGSVWGLMAGLQVLLALGAFYWGQLITVEFPGHPGHPPSTKLDAVVKRDVWSSWLLNDSKRGKQLT